MKKLLTGMMIMSLSAGAVSMAYAFAEVPASHAVAQSPTRAITLKTMGGVTFNATVNATDNAALGQMNPGDSLTVVGTREARAVEKK